MKYLSIIGTRPQYVKVLDNLKNHVVCDTRQHYDNQMSEVFLKQLKIKPKYNLNTTELGEMIGGCGKVIRSENPDCVIVYGDTRSTLAGALAAKFEGKMVAHVESGMRSYDMKQPEEIVRVIVDRISDYKFCANKFARQNLIKEGILNNVFVVGDPMWDSLNKVLPIPKSKDFEKYNVLTIHRQQNDNDEFFKEVFYAIEEFGEPFVFPAHPRILKRLKGLKVPKNIKIIKPLGYKEMISLTTNCKKVVTDSGGLQREAYWFSKPCVILRWETEWNEIVEDGWGTLVGGQKELILKALKDFNPTLSTNKPKFWPEYGCKERIKELLAG